MGTGGSPSTSRRARFRAGPSGSHMPSPVAACVIRLYTLEPGTQRGYGGKRQLAWNRLGAEGMSEAQTTGSRSRSATASASRNSVLVERITSGPRQASQQRLQQLVQQWPALARELTQEGEGVAAGMQHAVTRVVRLEGLAPFLQRMEVEPVSADERLEVRVRGKADLMPTRSHADAEGDIRLDVAAGTGGRDRDSDGSSSAGSSSGVGAAIRTRDRSRPPPAASRPRRSTGA